MKQQYLSKTFRAMGTVNSITVYEPDKKAALELAAMRVLELDDALSVFQPESEISQINAGAGARFVTVGQDTLFLLKTALYYARLSFGAFDITVRPLTKLWKKAAQSDTLPRREELEYARNLVNHRDIIIEEAKHAVMLRQKGQAVDLGGVAKGYAADEVRRILAENGVTNALINLGGTVIVMGETRTIGVQHPREHTGIPMGRLSVKNQTVVTSGDYERYVEIAGTRYHHILDPRTGAPAASGLYGVTLIGNSAMELDALSTGMFILGAEQGAKLARQLGLEAVFITDRLDVLCTSGLQGRFSLISNTKKVR